jgi:sirohydrochlorin ferrochelatase
MSRALVILDHGSRRPEAHAHLEVLAENVRERAPELFVTVAHLELAAPGLAQAIDACVAAGASEVCVHPFFLAPGRHLAEDVPGLIEAAQARHPGLSIRLLEAIGTRAELADVILATLA